MAHRTIPVDPFELIIFGGTGDLSLRKLLPALLHRDNDNQLPAETRILGVARSELDADGYRALVRDALITHESGNAVSAETLERFIGRLDYRHFDIANRDAWQELSDHVENLPGDRVVVYYLALGPSLFAPVISALGTHGLSRRGRLVVEKPFGRDLESARALNELLGQSFDEGQVFRIDHYLGKETVQNLMALRFANMLLEPVWNAHYVDHVQITAAESVGLETRAGYYDNAGAMRDMVQNHLLQLLCLTAMEPPSSFDADAIRDEKLKVLRALKPLDGAEALKRTVRGQYRSTRNTPGYLEELGNPDSCTETFVAIRAEIGNWRWAGTPFFLRTGKNLRGRVTEIHITFRRPPHFIFGDFEHRPHPNSLVIRLQPNEGLELDITTKDPGPGGFRLRQTPLDVSFASGLGTEWRMPDAYERLLLDVVRGNQTLFMRRDEVEAAWAWVDPIIKSWETAGERPEGYDAGGSGPTGALELVAADGVRWREIAA